MPLPEFNETGDLPVGVHRASLAETVARFAAGSDRRKLVARRLERIYRIASQTGHLARFIVFGSFVTGKHEPNDVDVFLIMDDNFDMGSLVGEPRLLLVDHRTARRTTSGPASSGCAEWQPSAVSRLRLKIGKSNGMALNVASSKSRRNDHDCRRSGIGCYA